MLGVLWRIFFILAGINVIGMVARVMSEGSLSEIMASFMVLGIVFCILWGMFAKLKHRARRPF